MRPFAHGLHTVCTLLRQLNWQAAVIPIAQERPHEYPRHPQAFLAPAQRAADRRRRAAGDRADPALRPLV